MIEDEHFGYQDILRLRRAPDGVFELVEVKERGGWRRFDYLISEKFAQAAELAAILARVQAANGVWVRDFGGCLGILLPRDSTWDPTDEIAESAGTSGSTQ